MNKEYTSINCKGQLIDLSTPRVMGILNVTPDSFYDGGKYTQPDELLRHTEKMLNEGAAFIDVGGYSSRPKASHISEATEQARVLPVVELLVKNFPDILISIDTFRSSIAAAAIAAGACMVNDISGGDMDEQMFTTVARLQVPYIVMHMQGTPQTMQLQPVYSNVVQDLIHYFSEKIFALRELGLNDIIIDVGFGFGKTMEHNYQLLKNLDLFNALGVPVLTGVSRKSMLWKLLGTSAQDALNATSVAHTIALLNGTHILRAHDVKEALEAVKITGYLRTVD